MNPTSELAEALEQARRRIPGEKWEETSSPQRARTALNPKLAAQGRSPSKTSTRRAGEEDVAGLRDSSGSEGDSSDRNAVACRRKPSLTEWYGAGEQDPSPAPVADAERPELRISRTWSDWFLDGASPPAAKTEDTALFSLQTPRLPDTVGDSGTGGLCPPPEKAAAAPGEMPERVPEEGESECHSVTGSPAGSFRGNAVAPSPTPAAAPEDAARCGSTRATREDERDAASAEADSAPPAPRPAACDPDREGHRVPLSWADDGPATLEGRAARGLCAGRWRRWRRVALVVAAVLVAGGGAAILFAHYRRARLAGLDAATGQRGACCASDGRPLLPCCASSVPAEGRLRAAAARLGAATPSPRADA